MFAFGSSSCATIGQQCAASFLQVAAQACVDVVCDGALSATEVTGRIYECADRDDVRAPTLVGHLTIFGPDDVARLAGRRAITGGVSVKGASLVELELPQLQSIGGTLRVDAAP